MSDSRMEGLAGFLIGAGLGAALASWCTELGPASAVAARGNLTDTGRLGAVAADVGRLHALLGEIRGLLGPRAVGLAEYRSGPDRASGRADGGIPDRLGRGILRGLESLAMPALFTAVAGAAYASFRKAGAAAAWPALAGFLTAGAWTSLLGHLPSTGNPRLGPAAPGPGTRWSRSNRPALP